MIWYIISLVLFFTELVTGTFYMLVISAAMLSAGLSEWLLNTNPYINALIAAVFSVVGIAVVRLWQHKHPRENKLLPSDNPDYGKTVLLIKKLPSNLWQVQYRGTTWQAHFEEQTEAEPGDTAQITGNNGNILNITTLPFNSIQE